MNTAANARPDRIVVVDDDARIRDLLRRYLTQEGFEVLLAEDSKALNRLLTRETVHLIVLDLMLPDLNGYAVCEELRRTNPFVPILMLTARSQETDKIRGLDAGADDYVTKPFGPPELVARLEAVLRRARPEASEPTILAEGLEIDLAARSVRRDGEPVHLTPTEFELLRALAQNRGRLMTHSALLSEVWGPAYADDLQVLRAHVANLRRKIEPAEGPLYIKTDAGVGYRFAA